MIDLQVERNPEDPTLAEAGLSVPGIAFTPSISPDYWAYRVMLTETQAILGFWKFGLIGVGFAVEEDWNTNLPHGADGIFDHISHNKGDERIADEDVKRAIALIDEAVRADGICDCRTCTEGET